MTLGSDHYDLTHFGVLYGHFGHLSTHLSTVCNLGLLATVEGVDLVDQCNAVKITHKTLIVKGRNNFVYIPMRNDVQSYDVS